MSIEPLGTSGLTTLLGALEEPATALRDAAARIGELEGMILASQAQRQTLRDALQGALRSAAQETCVDTLATVLATVHEDRARIALAVSLAFGPKGR